jgi:hypothetical protein
MVLLCKNGNAKERRKKDGLAFRMLPFAGITQIRFEGVSHPATMFFNLGQDP